MQKICKNHVKILLKIEKSLEQNGKSFIGNKTMTP